MPTQTQPPLDHHSLAITHRVPLDRNYIGHHLTPSLSLPLALDHHPPLHLPEHLKSWSCRSATFCPLSWLGEWHLVLGARRDADRKYRESHDRWQSQANGLSDRRSARRRRPAKRSRGKAVKLLLFKVLGMKRMKTWKYIVNNYKKMDLGVPRPFHLQDLQVTESLQRLFIDTGDLVVVELQGLDWGDSLEDSPPDRVQLVVGQVAVG